MLKLRNKLALIATSVAMLASAIGVAADAGREGNGGGGVKSGGKLMTFYSAGLYTEPFPIADGIAEVPGLYELVDFVRQFPYWNLAEKNDLIDKIMPSAKHEYYKVKEDDFDAITKARLVQEFSRVTGQPTDNIVLYAVTDTNSGRTFLLPEFYSLSTSDKVAILFHENYWLMQPQGTYDQVVAAEMAFEAVYEQPTNTARVLDLVSHYGDEASTLAAMAQADLTSDALNGLLTKKGIALKDLFGSDFFTCQDCTNGSISLNLMRLAHAYSKSLILGRMAKSATMTGKGLIMPRRGYGLVGQTRALSGRKTESLYSFKAEDFVQQDRSYYQGRTFSLSNCRLEMRIVDTSDAYSGEGGISESRLGKGIPIVCDGNVVAYLAF